MKSELTFNDCKMVVSTLISESIRVPISSQLEEREWGVETSFLGVPVQTRNLLRGIELMKDP